MWLAPGPCVSAAREVPAFCPPLDRLPRLIWPTARSAPLHLGCTLPCTRVQAAVVQPGPRVRPVPRDHRRPQHLQPRLLRLPVCQGAPDLQCPVIGEPRKESAKLIGEPIQDTGTPALLHHAVRHMLGHANPMSETIGFMALANGFLENPESQRSPWTHALT